MKDTDPVKLLGAIWKQYHKAEDALLGEIDRLQCDLDEIRWHIEEIDRMFDEKTELKDFSIDDIEYLEELDDFF